MNTHPNEALIEVLLNGIRCEWERIERAKAEISKLTEELTDLGWAPPPNEEWWQEWWKRT